MTSEPEKKPGSLDLTGYRAQDIVIKDGDREFAISTDLPSVLVARLQGWVATVRGRDPEEADAELLELCAWALGISAEEMPLQRPAQMRLASFLALLPLTPVALPPAS